MPFFLADFGCPTCSLWPKETGSLAGEVSSSDSSSFSLIEALTFLGTDVSLLLRLIAHPSSSRRCRRLIWLFESLIYVILGDARFGVALLVQILLLGAIAHHARMRGICLRFRFGRGCLAAASNARNNRFFPWRN